MAAQRRRTCLRRLEGVLQQVEPGVNCCGARAPLAHGLLSLAPRPYPVGIRLPADLRPVDRSAGPLPGADGKEGWLEAAVYEDPGLRRFFLIVRSPQRALYQWGTVAARGAPRDDLNGLQRRAVLSFRLVLEEADADFALGSLHNDVSDEIPDEALLLLGRSF